MMMRMTLTLLWALGLGGCSSLIFDQSTSDATNATPSFQQQLSSNAQGFALSMEEKQYETNRIFSNDFPVTYRAKSKQSF